ncbi:MAG: hypothetical protein LKF03_02740 [Eubacterium sp.]|nr:hypothetical protein [Eubacterium sp.]
MWKQNRLLSLPSRLLHLLQVSQQQCQGPKMGGGDVQQTPQHGEQNKITEPAVDAKTTASNNVNTAVSDDKQSTDISYKAWLFGAPLTASINADDANSNKTLSEVSKTFNKPGLGDVKAGDLVLKGDMSIDGDTTKAAAHDVEKDSKHDIKADLDVSAIHTSIEKSGMLINNADAVYVNNLETGLRSTFKFSDLNGEFYVPTTLADAQAHYVLSSADGNPLIYRINYANSTFTKDNVSILMDLDLTQMNQLNTSYNGSSKVLYGENCIKENFNHTDNEYGDTYDTSTFGNLKQLITKSAKKISLLLKGVTFHSATGNKNTRETDTETTTTTQGSIDGTLVGYMKADVGHSFLPGNVSYVWGAMQDPAGKDVNATDDKVMLTAQFTETTQKEAPSDPGTSDNPGNTDNPGTPVNPGDTDNPSTPVNPGDTDNPSTPVNPNNPVNPVTPVNPDNPTPDDGIVPNTPIKPTNPQKDTNQTTTDAGKDVTKSPVENGASTKTVTSHSQNPKAVATKTVASAETSNVPKTADETKVGTMLILFGGAAALLTVLLAVKKRENE